MSDRSSNSEALTAARAEAEAIHLQSLGAGTWEAAVHHADRIAALRLGGPFAADPELARLEAEVLFAAAEEVDSPGIGRRAANRISDLRRSDPALDTRELALIEARVLAWSGPLPDEAPQTPADRIAAIRSSSSGFEPSAFVRLEAEALVAACRDLAVRDEDAREAIASLVKRVARLRASAGAADRIVLAVHQARALAHGAAGRGRVFHELVADGLRELRREDAALQVVGAAIEEAYAVARACEGVSLGAAGAVRDALGFAERVARLRQECSEFNVLEIATSEAACIRHASRSASDSQEAEELSLRIAALRESDPRFQSPALAKLEAAAVEHASYQTEDAERSLALADRIRDLRGVRPEFQIPELARVEAQIVVHASVELVPAARLREGLALAERIAALRQEHPTFQTGRIALSEAYALYNCTLHTQDHAERAACAARIRELRESNRSFGLPEIALREAQAWMNACNRAPSGELALPLADRIAELRAWDPRFETYEIVMREARALVSASFCAASAESARNMAARVAAMRTEYATGDLALQQAKILTNASRHVETLGAAVELADDIAAIASSDPDLETLELAIQEAGALNNACSAARSMAECEPVLARIRALRSRGPDHEDCYEIALSLAKAYFNAMHEMADARGMLEFADRIAALRESRLVFQTHAMALREARALCLVSMRSEDGEACARLADRIAGLRGLDPSIDTLAIAMEEAEVLLRSVELGDAQRVPEWFERFERLRALVGRCVAEAPAELEAEVRELSARAAVIEGRAS